jgi:ABC-type oligopeptide transport system ATPase subunit
LAKACRPFFPQQLVYKITNLNKYLNFYGGFKLAIIGIIGKKGTGKTECSKVLIQNYKFKKISFADKLKEVACELWDIPKTNLYDPTMKEKVDPRWGKSYREIMQLFGTEICRVIHWDTWIYHVEKEFKSRTNESFVIDDVRFKNEAELIKKYGGILIKVVRPTIDFSDSVHASEVEQDQIQPDIIIMNDSTKKDLHRKVKEALSYSLF